MPYAPRRNKIERLHMRKYLFLLPLLAMLASCTEYSKVLKSRDVDYKFDYAKRAYEEKKYLQASTILNEIYTPLRGTANGEEALFLLAMSLIRFLFESKMVMNT